MMSDEERRWRENRHHQQTTGGRNPPFGGSDPRQLLLQKQQQQQQQQHQEQQRQATVQQQQHQQQRMATNTNLNPMYANNYHGATTNNRTDTNGSNGGRRMDGEQYARVFQQQQEMMMSRQIYSEGNQPSPHHEEQVLEEMPSNNLSCVPLQNIPQQRKRIRSILFLSALAFMGMLVLDGLVQFTDLSKNVDKTVREGVEHTAEILDEYEHRLVDNRVDHRGVLKNTDYAAMQGQGGSAEVSGGMASGLVRKLANYLLEDEAAEVAVPPPHRSYTEGGPGGAELLHMADKKEGGTINVPTTSKPRGLHTMPLLPKRTLQHRHRRELIDSSRPIPLHLQEGVEDEAYHAHNAQRRRRMYPMLKDENGNTIVDAGKLEEDAESGENVNMGRPGRTLSNQGSNGISRYETGALYQGYGTHYVDIFVGTPPQRQTVIVDTGSSITAFPCTGCADCGHDSVKKVQYHIDDDFEIEASSSYEEKTCKHGQYQGKQIKGAVPCNLGTCTRMTVSGQVSNGESHGFERCQVAVSYAEGSSWTAVEGSDVVYPMGPHEEELENHQEQLEAGVGVGMGNLGKNGDKEFDWMDFRLKFGCQNKVTGMFQTQLEDGIMGMDNRKGAFWLQLHEHYKKNGYEAPSGDNEHEGASFDPAQFSLCYDRQPLSDDLYKGTDSGALTLGGTDPLLHETDMVYAENVTPIGGWYAVRIKAIFLRTNGGMLSEPPKDSEYVRVNVEEKVLNGSTDKKKGVIVDSGTTDTYLPSGIKNAFNQAWKQTTGEDNYHNNMSEMTTEQVKSLPTIMVVLQGHGSNSNDGAIGMTGSHEDMFNSKEPTEISKSDIVVAIPPAHYMEESRRSPGHFTARVYFSEKYGAQSILGSNFMMGHEVNFDIGKGRVGFAESHCDYSRYVEERDAEQQKVQGQEEEAETRVAQTDKEEPHLDNDLATSGWARFLNDIEENVHRRL